MHAYSSKETEGVNMHIGTTGDGGVRMHIGTTGDACVYPEETGRGINSIGTTGHAWFLPQRREREQRHWLLQIHWNCKEREQTHWYGRCMVFTTPTTLGEGEGADTLAYICVGFVGLSVVLSLNVKLAHSLAVAQILAACAYVKLPSL